MTLTKKKLPADIPAGGLYIHIPFCVRKCPYCDFYSTTDETLKPDFIKMLIREMENVGRTFFPIDSLYIGGGTPSLMSASDIGRIIETAHRVFTLLPDVEITIEVNPGTIGFQQLKDLRHAGINRINIGVQSFHDSQLQFLGRIHSEKEARLAIKYARQTEYPHLGLDLMYGISGQTKQHWLKDLQEAVGFTPEHLSCYMLTYEPHTPLDNDRKKGRFVLPDDGHLADLFETTHRFLKDNGFDPYEISNFERSDPNGHHTHRSRHNQKYWTYAPYLGFGPSAHSFIEPVRHWNVRDIKTYITQLDAWRSPVAGKETLTREQQMIEWIYLGLRQTDGISIEGFQQKFNTDFYILFGLLVADLTKKGLMKANERVCGLTTAGMLFCDSITDRWVSYGLNNLTA